MWNDSQALSLEVTVRNVLGLHARPAARIAKIANAAKSRIRLIKDGDAVDASSIIDILSMGCAQGSRVTIQIEDPSDSDVLNAIAGLFESGFGE